MTSKDLVLLLSDKNVLDEARRERQWREGEIVDFIFGCDVNEQYLQTICVPNPAIVLSRMIRNGDFDDMPMPECERRFAAVDEFAKMWEGEGRITGREFVDRCMKQYGGLPSFVFDCGNQQELAGFVYAQCRL